MCSFFYSTFSIDEMSSGSGGGPLTIILPLLTSSNVSLDLAAHSDTLQFAGNLVAGIYCKIFLHLSLSLSAQMVRKKEEIKQRWNEQSWDDHISIIWFKCMLHGSHFSFKKFKVLMLCFQVLYTGVCSLLMTQALEVRVMGSSGRRCLTDFWSHSWTSCFTTSPG